MKARVVQGGIGTYEVQVKRAWYLPWQTVYNGMFPFRASLSEARKLANKLTNTIKAK